MYVFPLSVFVADVLVQGIERNFAHKALYNISVAAYYGTSQKLLGRTPEFKEYIPVGAIVLIAAGVCLFLSRLDYWLTVYRSRVFSLRFGPMARSEGSRILLSPLTPKYMRNFMS